MTRRKIAAAASVLALTSGCSQLGVKGIQDLPLPGGADVGDHPYTVTAQFANVLNLVPQSAVKVSDVTIGKVTKVSLPQGSWTANVTMIINADVKLPANAYAQLRQSNLLGEKFIQLAAPTDGSGTGPDAGGRLVDGATIPASRTNRNPEVEEVFGALSLLLNGGGLAQLKTITTELNNALNGNEPEIKSMLRQVTKLTSTLNGNRQGITDALDGLNRLASTLNSRQRQIATVLDDLEPGLAVLERQRGALVRMLGSLDRLSAVAVETIDRSKDDMVADLKALEPTLRKLSDAGRNLPDALQVLLTYPFTDAVLPAVKGDYLNVYLSVTATPGTQIIPPIKDSSDLPLPLPAAPGPQGAGN